MLRICATAEPSSAQQKEVPTHLRVFLSCQGDRIEAEKTGCKYGNCWKTNFKPLLIDPPIRKHRRIKYDQITDINISTY